MDTRNINVITLAYLGDAIYEVYIRKHLIEKGIALVDDLQKEAVKYVSAKNQSRILKWLEDKNIFKEETTKGEVILKIQILLPIRILLDLKP